MTTLKQRLVDLATKTGYEIRGLQAQVAALSSSILSGGGTWGSITGSIASQSDLQTALGSRPPVVTPQQYGAIGDGVTDNLAAWAALTAYFKSLPASGYYDAFSGTYRPFPKLWIPKGNYYFSGSVELDGGTWDIECEGLAGAQNGGYGVTFTFAAGNDGIVAQNWNTTGLNAAKTSRAQTYGAQGSRIRGLTVRSLGAGSNATACGFWSRTKIVLEDCAAFGFPSHGCYIAATAGSGGATEGNANNCRIIGGHYAKNAGAGIAFSGADANSGIVIGANVSSNGTWGVQDDSFLGNFFYGGHSAANGWDGAAFSGVPTACTYLGNRYFVRAGQAVGASTNAPTGTTLDNTWWGYIAAGGTYPNGIVAWVSGTAFAEGGGYKSSNANSSGSFIDCYNEGDQNPPQINAPATIFGGNTALGNRGSSQPLRPDTSGYWKFGPQQGTADGTTFFLTTNSFHTLQGSLYSNGGATLTPIGSLSFTYGNGNIYDVGNAGWSHRFRVNGTTALLIGSTGLTYQSGYNPTLTEIAAASVTSPAAGSQTLFIDTADHKLKRKDSSGTVTIIA